MKISIMQPYLFPYIGYFQLINMADKFVIHDDVQYIKGGWINRNRILLNREAYLFTLSIKNDSAFLNINQRFFTENFDKERKKILNIVELSYRKAPYYSNVKKLLDCIFYLDKMNISQMIIHSLKIICDYLDINTQFYISSELTKDNTLKGEQRVININKCLEADHYINSIGGEKLYSRDVFEKNDIKLSFLQPRFAEYSQFDNQFVPWLSIIDVLMFNNKEEVQEILSQYDLM
jgi:hypothetical protein